MITFISKEQVPYPPFWAQWSAVALLTFLYILSMLDRNLILIVGDSIKKDMALSDLQLALLYGASFSISYGICSLPIGWALDKYKRINVIYICVTVWSLAAISCGLVRNYAWIFVSRCFIGAGEAGLTPGATTIFSDMFPPGKLALPISIYFSGAKLGQSLSFIIGGGLAMLIAPEAIFTFANLPLKGWQLIFIVVGIPGIFLAFLIFLIPEPARRDAASDGTELVDYRGYLKYALRNKSFFVGVHLGALCYFITVVAVISWSVAYLHRVHGLSAQASGGLLGASMLFAPLIGSPVHGYIVDHRLRAGVKDAPLRHLLLMGVIAFPIGIGAFFMKEAVVSLVMISVFIVLLSGYSSLPATAMITFVPSRLRGKSVAVVILLVSSVGSAVAPVVVASFNEYFFRGNHNVGLGIAATIALFMPLGAGCLLAALSPMRKHSPV